MYQELKQLPSKGLAYPPGTKISVRPLKFGEVIEFTERHGEPIDYYNYLAGRSIVDGIDFWEITTGDWQYIELSMITVSYATPSLTINGPPCDKCSKEPPIPPDEKKKDVPQEVVALLPGMDRKKIPKEYTARLLPTDLIFNTVDDKLTGPVSVDLVNGKSASLDFFRIKHHMQMLQSEKSGVDEEIALITGLDFSNDVEFEDYAALEEAYGLFSHGLDDAIELQCPNCGTKKVMEVDWRASQLIPFRADEKLIRSRIHIGEVSESADKGPSRPPVPPSESSLRPAGGRQ